MLTRLYPLLERIGERGRAAYLDRIDRDVHRVRVTVADPVLSMTSPDSSVDTGDSYTRSDRNEPFEPPR